MPKRPFRAGRGSAPVFRALLVRASCLWALGAVTGCVVFVGPDGVCEGSFDSLQICVDRSGYSPGSVLRLTMSNRSRESVFLDGCSLHLIERGQLGTFGSVYDPARRCGVDYTLDDVLDRMDEIRPGETLVRTVAISAGLPQGFYRILQWRLDAGGALLSREPLRSGEFDIFPSAG